MKGWGTQVWMSMNCAPTNTASGGYGVPPPCLFKAVRSRSKKKVKKAIAGGATLEDRDYIFGRTPLHFAVEQRRLDVLQALLDAGADPNARAPRRDYTPLHVACFWRWWEGLKLLIDHGGDPTLLNEGGLSPLDLASEEDLKPLVQSAISRQRRGIRMHWLVQLRAEATKAGTRREDQPVAVSPTPEAGTKEEDEAGGVSPTAADGGRGGRGWRGQGHGEGWRRLSSAVLRRTLNESMLACRRGLLRRVGGGRSSCPGCSSCCCYCHNPPTGKARRCSRKRKRSGSGGGSGNRARKCPTHSLDKELLTTLRSLCAMEDDTFLHVCTFL